MTKKLQQIKRNFHDDLILNQWVLSLFNQKDLSHFKSHLDNEQFEGIAQDGHTRFFNELQSGVFKTATGLPNDLSRYDLDIVEYWQKITYKRNKNAGHELNLKYFQYLSLLFTEIYLDYYFNYQNELLDALNEQLALAKADPEIPNFQTYTQQDLNKLAFWNATGSGKTLLMHVNILQYAHYQGRDDLTVFVITPNEGLSKQHLNEFSASNIPATLFDKNKGIQQGVFGADVQILDINKLAEKEGELTVSVSSFDGLNKLVLIDEGHRGSTGNSWLERRQKMIGSGFAFEYSATFGQAVKDRKTVEDIENDIRKKKAKLLPNKLTATAVKQLQLTPQEKVDARNQSVFETYAKSILFDYSYKYFYADGYGKEFHILNMKAESYGQQENDRKYFIACLLSFYQQLYLFEKNKAKLTVYNLEKPLWVFVGNTVNQENSDIVQIVDHLAFFLEATNREQILSWLSDLIENKAILLNSKGNNLFERQFLPLHHFISDVNALYQDILLRLFNANSTQQLYLRQLKKATGEMALQVGSHDYFALINVGDVAELVKKMANQIDCTLASDEFSTGLFHEINRPSSPLNLLIGSRKFTEGWSSWRVSTMGLMNMGRGEGSQIIQLFGRGVRLKGKDFSLRRTLKNLETEKLWLDKLETLNIFGIKADYMASFREYLEQEDISPSDEILTLDFPVQKNLPQNISLKTLHLKNLYRGNQQLGFKRQKPVVLYDIPNEFDGKIKEIRAVLDLYPRLQALNSSDKSTNSDDQRQTHKINQKIFPFFNWDKIYLALQQFKEQKNWFNFRLSKEKLLNFLQNNTEWYKLYIPKSALEIHSFSDIEKQQDILLQLLKIYTEQFYIRLKSAYENQFFELTEFNEQNGSFFDSYTIVFSDEDTNERQLAFDKLNELSALVKNKKIDQAMGLHSIVNGLYAICLPEHLFCPLFEADERKNLPLTISPLPLVGSEIQFINELKQAKETKELDKWIKGYSLYIMRNADRAEKGLGFSLAGNFYPDFLLWVVDHGTGKQWLNFIDPKGIRNMSLNDPKFGLYKEVKTYEKQINCPDLILNSFILSHTAYSDLLNNEKPKQELEDRHILFMQDDDYLEKMFERMNLS